MSAGRPTRYKSEYCQALLDHMEQGLSFLSFAGTIGVCFDTLYEWERVHPEFSEAKKRGVAMSLAWDEKLLNKGTEGKQRGYNIAAHKWKMANRYKWTERHEMKIEDLSQKDTEELKREAALLVGIKLED